MMFDPEAIERLTPADRIAVQDWIVRRWLALHTRRTPERRKAPKRWARLPIATAREIEREFLRQTRIARVR